MKLHLHFVALSLVSSTVLALLPIPKLHFDEQIIEDDETVITCTLKYTELLEVNLEIKGNTTFRDCKQKTENQTNNEIQTIKTCKIDVTKEMDQMEFTCEAQFKTQSKPEKMYLQTEPTITDCPDKLFWVEGEENSFHCKATGYPTPTVTCKKDNVDYKEGQNYKTFRNMTGTYSCVARNFDADKKSVEVSVQYKPKVLEIKVNPPLRDEGDTVTLTCKADADPAPTYTWRTIQPSNVQFSPDNTTITIQGLKKSHLGKYMCTASNKHGSHSLEEELALAVKPKMSNIKVEPSMEVLEGDNITLSCEAKGSPPPTLSWVTPSLEVQRSPDNRTLKIWRLQKKHIGTYSCSAQNKHGKDSRTQIITLAGKGDKTETSITIILTMLMSTSLMFYLS
ncbi:limbic system-associated membrane protein-like isoform 2-T3 [Leptodactylus fuscus]|uniref:limbic system-associated membrane protein-like isoform X2 n=1 Tax=Leptodactylus fuscus TaxID=238119 RepID=UPI003F4E9956